MSNVDKRNRLEEKMFSYRITKDGKVYICWHNKQVKIFKGEQAKKLILKISRADEKNRQLLWQK